MNARYFKKSLELQKRFNDLIPGGAHTYAKGDDQFPEFMPLYIKKGRGCRVWDVDGNEFIEYGNGLRSVGLGHAFEPVSRAACDQIQQGTNFGRPATIELECAEEFLDIVRTADMVKFCKNGSDAVDAAIRIARAVTGREMIACCSSHPFFSTGDWFIGSTEMPTGIPEASRKLTKKFDYNDLSSVHRLFDEYPYQIACVILEPQKYEEPAGNFLRDLKDLCRKNGSLLIFDEMITGFRWALGGAQKKFGVIPDLSTWGKAMGNGFSIAAIAGKREFMERGGLGHRQERVFLLSTTHGAETHALAAAMATMRYYKENDVVGRLYNQGDKLAAGIMKASDDLGLDRKVTIVGPGCCSAYVTLDQDNRPSQSFRTLFLQETLKRGLLMPSTVISYSHTDADVAETVEKVHEALTIYKKALCEGIEKYLEGRSIKPVYRKYN